VLTPRAEPHRLFAVYGVAAVPGRSVELHAAEFMTAAPAGTRDGAAHCYVLSRAPADDADAASDACVMSYLQGLDEILTRTSRRRVESIFAKLMTGTHKWRAQAHANDG
jgi:hypothetical protein